MAGSLTTQKAARAADFTGSIGVNAHLNYTDGRYGDIQTVLADLRYLGVDLVRTASLNAAYDPNGQKHYDTAANAGIRFDLVVDGNTALASTVSLIDKFDAAHPTAIASIEGPNEIDHWPIRYQGLTGGAAAIAYQKALFAAVNADASIADIPVYSFSLGSGAVPSGGYDAVALHPYPQHGEQPGAWFQNELKLVPAGAKPVFSEFGYSTVSTVWAGTDKTTQAKATLNGLFDAAKLGIPRVYLYELLEAYPDASGKDMSKHFGLFDYGNKPKPAATALHNLTTILDDPASNDRSFTTGSVSYGLTNMPAKGSSMLLEKSSGAYDLVLWAEPQIWDGATNKAVAAAASSVAVELGSTAKTVKIYDPLVGTAPIATYANVKTFNVKLSDHPVIVEFVPGGTATPQTPTGGTPAATARSGTAASIVAQLDALNALAGLTSITLTDTHVLPVASVAQMNHFIAADAKALAAIEGGYSFALTTKTTDSLKVVHYDAAGHQSVQAIHQWQGAAPASAADAYGATSTIYFADIAGSRTTTTISGTVAVQDHRAYVLMSAGNNVDSVVNKGSMVGNVVLGGGNDTFDSSGGRVMGFVGGGAGADKLTGGTGGDTLLGGDGDDTIKGLAGNDKITGGQGRDSLYGGVGADTFVFTVKTDSTVAVAGQDVIFDFSHAAQDRIDLSGLDASTLAAGNQAFHFIGTAAFGHHAGELRYARSGADVVVSGDIDGNGTADFAIQLKTVAALVAADFIL